MSTLQEILDVIETASLADVLVEGFVEYDPVYRIERLQIVPRRVYLRFADKFLRCTSKFKYYLEIENVNHVEPDLSEPNYAVCSLYGILVKHSDQDLPVTRLVAYTDQSSNLGEGIVRSAAFELSKPDSLGDQDLIFLDPWNTYGIRLGSHELMRQWVRDNATLGKEYPPGTKYEAHIWRWPLKQTEPPEGT